MGEGFLGFPNGFRNIDNLQESEYNPNHFLSAHMGFKLNEDMKKYLPLAGGQLNGELKTGALIPTAASAYDIGTNVFKYHNIYASNIYGNLVGNADTASKIKDKITITLNGAVTGSCTFDGSNPVTITTSANHNHDGTYLKLTGGSLTGNVLLGESASILNSDSGVLLSHSNNTLEINKASMISGKGNTTIYTSGDLDVRTRSSGITITSSLFNKTVNVGISEDAVYIENTEGNHFLKITDDGKLYLDDRELTPCEEQTSRDASADVLDRISIIGSILNFLGMKIDQLEVKTGTKETREWDELFEEPSMNSLLGGLICDIKDHGNSTIDIFKNAKE